MSDRERELRDEVVTAAVYWRMLETESPCGPRQPWEMNDALAKLRLCIDTLVEHCANRGET